MQKKKIIEKDYINKMTLYIIWLAFHISNQNKSYHTETIVSNDDDNNDDRSTTYNMITK